MTRGRPSLAILLSALDNEIDQLHKLLGGLPTSIATDNIWKDIWLKDTHHSTALEGNTLTPREVYSLVQQ